jgi:phosphoribosylformylglycinamidine (FGAM) synthase-like enzyme/phosphoribosylformylglycinamidine (FGAM) synthase PurS component
MDYHVQVYWNASVPDGRAKAVLDDIRVLGVDGVHAVRVSDLYFLRGDLPVEQVERLCHELLVDSVVQGFQVKGSRSTGYSSLGTQPSTSNLQSATCNPCTVLEVGFHPGVTDSVAENLVKGAARLGIEVQQAATGTRYELLGDVSEPAVHHIAAGLLCNEVIQSYTLGEMQPPFAPAAQASDVVEMIPIREMEDDELEQTSVDRVLFLDLPEMQAIRAYYRGEGRDPTDVELETLAQTWSEHCVHKTFKAVIEYQIANGTVLCIDGLLKTYIRAATEAIDKPWVRSAFVDNAGILAFDDEWDVSFKVETHNHPSALEPFGGANTGVGGVVRDIIGVSARPIANTDVLCFGPQGLPPGQVPGGALHPRRIADGVIAGIEDYGNKMGIPTVNGAIRYDPGYTGNPLVFCGCVGIAPRDSHRCLAQPGDLCVSVGGRTGRDGLHGATFSSAELTHETGETVGSVVQIGNPIAEKAFLEAVLVARDEGLYTAITDCGAGGFSSAVGEMGRAVGVEVDLSTAPLKYPGLRPWEIWLSEAQERMVLAVPPQNLDRLRQICDERDVELTVIGRFAGDRRLTLRYGDRLAGSMDMDFLHDGIPQRHLWAAWRSPRKTRGISAASRTPIGDSAPRSSSECAAKCCATLRQIDRQNTRDLCCSSHALGVRRKALRDAPTDCSSLLVRLLASPNIASKEAVVHRYDHEVQGGTIVKPLTGVENDGPSDATVLRPLDPQLARGHVSYRGIALGCGINPRYGLIDPYAMAWAAIDEAMRNVVAVGADPDGVALLDNFCWGNPNLPDRLGGLVRAAQGCYDASIAYGAPFVSGKDSLNNEYVDPNGVKTPIPPTLLISALGFVPDVRQAVTMDCKSPKSRLYILGETRVELGGSALYELDGVLGAGVPAPIPASIDTMRALHRAIRQGLVRACHDCSEGGLAVAAAEMAFAGGLGLTVRLADLPRPDGTMDEVGALFGETSGRFLVEVQEEDAVVFEQVVAGVPHAPLGEVGGDSLCVIGFSGQQVIQAGLDVLKAAWKGVQVA